MSYDFIVTLQVLHSISFSMCCIISYHLYIWDVKLINCTPYNIHSFFVYLQIYVVEYGYNFDKENDERSIEKCVHVHCNMKKMSEQDTTCNMEDLKSVVQGFHIR